MCEEISENALVPCKMKRRLTATHPSLACKDETHFHRFMQEETENNKCL
jgi:hypothetical protein